MISMGFRCLQLAGRPSHLALTKTFVHSNLTHLTSLRISSILIPSSTPLQQVMSCLIFFLEIDGQNPTQAGADGGWLLRHLYGGISMFGELLKLL